MLVVFSPIFVADTKITFVYNFVAPLKFYATTVSLIKFTLKILQYIRLQINRSSKGFLKISQNSQENTAPESLF